MRCALPQGCFRGGALGMFQGPCYMDVLGVVFYFADVSGACFRDVLGVVFYLGDVS